MGAKTIGLSRDLLIHPGETIADILEERNITQKELARRAGVSEPFLCDVIRGRKDISKGLAKGLEYALGVKSSFWLNLQANYDAELLMLDEEDSIEEEERSVYVKMKEIVDCLKKQSKIEQSKTEGEAIISLRKYLRVSRLTGLKSFATDGAFRISGKIAVDPDILGAWICMCQADSSERKLSRKFDKAKMEKLIRSLKQIMKNHEDPQPELVDLFADYGIDFSVAPNFKGAPIQGYLAKKNDENYQSLPGDDKVISGESGAAGAGFAVTLLKSKDLEAFKEELGLDENSVILCFSTEGDTDKKNYRDIVWDGKYPSFE